MNDLYANRLLAKVMEWNAQEVREHLRRFELLASLKYDDYKRFAPGKHFIESLALWLNQFDPLDRPEAMKFVANRMIFISDHELSHIVQHVYPDIIVQDRINLVAEEQGIPDFKVGMISKHPRYLALRSKTLYLGLSDGARTAELRRASFGEINNEQIWQAYELSREKSDDMLKGLKKALGQPAESTADTAFTTVWLIDDFSASGNTYIRFSPETSSYKGKIKKAYEALHNLGLIDPSHYEIQLLLYVATRQAVDHIDYWSERFTSEHNYKPLHLKVGFLLENDVPIDKTGDAATYSLVMQDQYYDPAVFDNHLKVGGTDDAKLGFAGCALPLVLFHNTPNNSIYLLWGPDVSSFVGLFPRLSRHKEL